MLDKMRKIITFTIEGNDYEQLMKFQKNHKDCLVKFPDMIGVQFEYTIIEDGLGVFTTCRCCCGKAVVLDGADNLVIDSGEKIRAPKFQILTEDKKTKEILGVLFAMEKRPKMYFETVSYSALNCFLAGYGMGTRLKSEGDEVSWSQIIEQDVHSNFFHEIKDKNYTDEELFYKFFEVLRSVLKDRYPSYLQEDSGFPINIL